ncbi:hypothetical protein BIU98_01040 [Curtobacterium sp. MMLR14_010]|uniref:hypothetical protein n=1 Tax=Curtobacterium sp. MMLR14_010 TaxID=1898743 RepID=UPI0008DD2DC8|nr:hypothetical protein [Curtobacterium sp. MMLR14_010]OII34608.1 hypothetical protein BIU98_01040 [Curtobacterium sp. MMLR14_010]
MLPDGAIFCGECGRAVSAAASRRTVAPEPVDRGTPPPLQQPDAHGRRQDPAAEAWLPESTLDPATRAWLTGADRREEHPPAVPVSTPDSFAPRTAPTHVHGAGSGLGEWNGRQEAPAVPGEHVAPAAEHDRSAPQHGVSEDDPEVTRVAPRAQAPTAAPSPSTAPAAGPVAPAGESVDQGPSPVVEPATPFWAPPQEQQAPAAPSAPSWWIGRTTDDRATAEPDDTGTVADTSTVAGTGAETSTVAGAGAADHARPDDARLDEAADGAAADDTARSGDTAVVEPLVDRQPPRPTSLVQPGAHHPTTCHVCGHQLEPDDIFCNECGAVRPAVTAAFTGPVMPLPMLRPDWAARDLDTTDGDEATPAVDDEPAMPDEPVVDASASHAGEHEGAPLAAPLPPLPGAAHDAGDQHGQEAQGASVTDAPPVDVVSTGGVVEDAPAVDEVDAVAADVDVAPDDEVPADVQVAADVDVAPDDEDVDETRIVSKTPTRAPFVLHFSTGERLGLHGTALFGRLPRPEPGERFDDLLTIHDPGKSVSKTHLELGRDGDDLWVSDRFSGNGSVIRHIDGSIRRCEPGRRYRVERGARVDVGEQFFLVQ